MLGFFVLAVTVTQAPAPCTASLSGRTGHSLAYDARNQRVLLFGGSSDEPGDPYPRSLWAWTGERWECLSGDGPPGRRDAFLAYDAARSRLVLFGGNPREDHPRKPRAVIRKPVHISIRKARARGHFDFEDLPPADRRRGRQSMHQPANGQQQP